MSFYSWIRLVSGAKLAPQGRLRKAQGASPGNKHRNKGSPEGAMQLVPVPKWRLMTSIYLELRSNSPCAALSGLSAIWPLNPGLAPWAVLLDPFGVLGFAPETSLRQSEGDQDITKTVVVFVASTRRDDDKLLAGLDAFESHGCGVAARRKPCYPEFAAVVLIEGPKTTVVCGGNEDQTAGRYDRAAQVGRAR